MFLNPLMLAGLGGAAVPLVLHLLSRARHRPVEWGAMMFLTGTEARQRHSARVKQWVLLLLRMATVAALAIALARPALRGRLGGLAASGRATAVIVLDDSASMNYVENGRSRLDQAKQAVLQILSAMNRGDQVSLLVTRMPQTNADRAPTSDLQSIAARVAAVHPGAADASFAESLNRAGDVLERYERQNREIYIVCDRQAFSWRRLNDAFLRGWQARWANGLAPRVTVIEVGGDAADNVVVESLDLLNPPLVKDQPGEVEVRVRNYGSVPRGALPLTLRVDGRTVADATITVAPDAAAVARIPFRIADAGSHVLSASVRSSGLTTDDHLESAIDVSDPTRVLIVGGDEDDRPAGRGATSQPFDDAASLLQLALAPYATTHRDGADAAMVQVISPQQWSNVKLEQFDVVILANVDRLAPAQARDVEHFVYAGGGLLIAPGNLSRVDEYDNALFRFGAGIMPASLGSATAVDGSGATSIQSVDVNHPLFRFLDAKADALSSIMVTRYFPATARTSDAHVLAAYASGSPFVVEGAAGRGKVLLITTSLDARWSNLPATNFFLPFVQSAVRYLARSVVDNRNLSPGQPIIALVDEPVDEHSITLRLPNSQVETLPATRFEDRTDLRYARTEEPGIYRLRYRSAGKERTLHYVVTSPRAESDLTPMDDERWHRLTQSFGFERIDPARTPVVAAVARDRGGRELWMAALVSVFVLAAAEMLLARLWSADTA